MGHINSATARLSTIDALERDIKHSIFHEEIDRMDFEAALDEMAFDVPFPRLSSMTYIGEYLNDYVLTECNAPEYSDEETNAMAATAYALCPEFRIHFAHHYRLWIIRDVEEKRRRAAEDFKARMDAGLED